MTAPMMIASLAGAGRVGLGASLVIALAFGAFGRFAGLGNFPLAVDEYYFVRSVESVLQHGVPAFETGGYYPRGLLLQYLTAGSVVLFGNDEFAHRLPAAVFSLATVPLAYVYGKALLGRLGAGALAIMLLLSAWEIEFGRFARMYSALQFFTLVFFIAAGKAAQQRRWTYAPHVVFVLTCLVHEFAILLVPFLFVPAMTAINGARRATPRVSPAWLLVTSAVALLCYSYLTSDFRNEDVVNALPADVRYDGASPYHLPIVPFFGDSRPETMLSLYVGLGAAVAATFVALRWMAKRVSEGDLLGMLVLLSAMFHQFLIAGSLVLLVFARRSRWDSDREKRRTYTMLAGAALVASSWLVYAVSAREWIAHTFRPEYGFSPDYTLGKALIRTFVGWPLIIDPVVLPWLEHLPLLGACAVAAGVYQIATKGGANLVGLAANPVAVLAVVVLAFGVQASPYTSIRYSFFVYPFVLALIVLSAVEAARAIMRHRRGGERLGTAIGVAASLLIFVGSTDFQLRQILGVAGPSVRLRLGEFARYEGIWYERWDYESPARFINERAGVGDDHKVVVVAQQPVSFYLRIPHAVYYARTQSLFYDHSRVGGTIDLWSNQRLLSTAQELREYTKCAAAVWIVEPVSPVRRPFEIEQVWPQRLVRTTELFQGVDGRLAVIRAELQNPNDC